MIQMRLLALCLATIFVLGLTGCIPSIHGIVIPGEELLDDRILGTWMLTDDASDSNPVTSGDVSVNESEDNPEDMIWVFERAASLTFSNSDGSSSTSMPIAAPSLCPPGMEITESKPLPYYFLTHTDLTEKDTITTNLLVYLTAIDDHLFMDFQPYPIRENALLGRFSTNFVLAHTFAWFSVTDDGISIKSLNGDYIEELIRNRRIRLKHEINGNGDIILTASTEELRGFLTKYANNEELYDLKETLAPIYQ